VKLALGTAQFGLPYGVANQAGQVSVSAGGAIIAIARARGVDTVDTAIAYGTSEATLGTIGMEGLRVVTKLPAMPAEVSDPGPWVAGHLALSCARLGLSSLYGVLLHAPAQLLGASGPALYDALVQAKHDGVVAKIGVSIYSPTDLQGIWPQFALDLVQSPFNVLDRRLVSSGTLAAFAAAGVECHVRSVFLQGLLVMPPTQRPAAFGRWAPTLAAFDAWVAGTGLSPTAACLRVALSQPGIDRVVVGLDTLEQADQLLAIAGAIDELAAPDFGDVDPDLLNPSRWPRA
jgi:aryl-alcohol dehydrogenase-like predicted oxidoreductase